MNKFNIKINGKYLKDFYDTNMPQKFRGEWHNNTRQLCTNFNLCKKENAKVVEGNINLKSQLDLIIGIYRDGYFKINKFEVIKL